MFSKPAHHVKRLWVCVSNRGALIRDRTDAVAHGGYLRRWELAGSTAKNRGDTQTAATKEGPRRRRLSGIFSGPP